jgi:hypothetical protein
MALTIESAGSAAGSAAGLAGVLAEVAPILDERQRRVLAGAGARQLGRGGIKLVAAATGRTVDCVTGAPTSVIDEAVAPGASGLTYDVETGVYTWVWKTSKPWASTCRVVELRLDDGSVHSAQFKLR